MAPSTRTSPWRRPRCASRPPPVAGTFPRRATTPRGFARRSLRRRSAGDATRSAPRSGREAPRLCGSLEAASCPSTRSTPPCRRRRCVAEPAQIAAPSFLCNNQSITSPIPSAREGGHGSRTHVRARARRPGFPPPPNAAREKHRPRTRLTELVPPTHRARPPPPHGFSLVRNDPKLPNRRRRRDVSRFRSIGNRRRFVENERRVFSIPPTTATRAASGSWAS